MAVGFGMANQMGQAFAGGGAGAPPPIPGAQTSFFIADGGQQKGPFTMEQLREEVTAGRLARGTLAWRSGMPNWVSADTIPELSGLFVSVPPPLPKP
jgi:hypothetical protein